MLTIYSKNNCPFCVRAKQLLENKGVPFTEINIEKDQDARQMLLDKGLRSVPQIFHGYELLPGGFDGLAKRPEDFFQKLKENK